MNRIAQEAHTRQRMLEFFLRHKNATEASIRYQVSRKTLYKWLKRYDGTWQSLVDRSRRPHTFPRMHSEEEIRQILRLAKKYLWRDLIRSYQEMREKRNNQPYQRAEYPGQKVQADVKITPRECMVSGEEYYQFTAVDECTCWTYREIQTDNGAEFTKALVSSAPKARVVFSGCIPIFSCSTLCLDSFLPSNVLPMLDAGTQDTN